MDCIQHQGVNLIKENIMNNSNDTVTIDKQQYLKLQSDSNMLQALYAAGVDNWEGYEDALDIMDENDD